MACDAASQAERFMAFRRIVYVSYTFKDLDVREEWFRVRLPTLLQCQTSCRMFQAEWLNSAASKATMCQQFVWLRVTKIDMSPNTENTLSRSGYRTFCGHNVLFSVQFSRQWDIFYYLLSEERLWVGWVESTFEVRSLIEIFMDVSTNINAAFFRAINMKFIRSNYIGLSHRSIREIDVSVGGIRITKN